MRDLKTAFIYGLMSLISFTSAYSNGDTNFYLNPSENGEIYEDIGTDVSCAGYDLNKSAAADAGWCRLIGGVTFGKFIGLNHGYGELGFMAGLPVYENSQCFVDAREFRLSNNDWAGSIGVGCRYACQDLCEDTYEIYGLNVYYDFRQTHFEQDLDCNTDCSLTRHSNKNFSRIGVGGEYLSSYFDLRVNGYIPIVKSSHYGNTIFFDNIPGGFSGSYRNAEFLRWGVDGEVGKSFGFWNDYIYAYLGVGPYYYKHKEIPGITGVQARVEINWKKYLSLEFRYSYDREFLSKYQGQVQFTIPLRTLLNFFCPEEPACGCPIPWDQRVIRNYVPFIDNTTCWEWHWPTTSL